MIPCPTAITDPFDLMDSLQLAHGNPTNKRTKTKLERTLSLPNEVDVSQCSTNLEYLQHMSNHLQFYRYLTDVVGTDSSEKSRKEGTVIMDLGRNKWTQPEKPQSSHTMADDRSTSKSRKHRKKKESLEVLCRLTPYAGNDPAVRLYNETTVCTSPPSGLLQRSGSPYPEALYNFGYVFDESESQLDVFERSTLDMIEQMVRGKNGLLFTYGVTGSGKTYTMTGMESSRDCGILPRAVDALFQSLPNQMHSGVFVPNGRNGFDVMPDVPVPKREPVLETQWHIRGSKKINGFNDGMVSAVFVSYVEIYNNLCYDLFDETLTDDRANKSRELRVNGSSVYVDNLTEIEVQNTDEVMELYARAQERRKVAETLLNKTSSRSHSIFNIRLVMAPWRPNDFYPVDDPSQIVIGQLSMVDLAGSERTKRTGNNGDRLVEAGKINQSLMALRQCFERIRERDRNNAVAPIPYRDSKITHLFKNFFEGSGKIRMIVCVNPRPGDFEENLNVLNFGELSQEISTSVAPDPVMPKLVDATNSQFSRREIMNWRRRFDELVLKAAPQPNPLNWQPLPRLNYADPDIMAEQIEERRKAIMKHRAERQIYSEQLGQKRADFHERFIQVLCQMDLTNNRLKSVDDENEELRTESSRLQRQLQQFMRENSALKLRVARSEIDEEHKLRQDKRERQRAAEIEEECRAKNRKIEQMRDLFESRTPIGTTPATSSEAMSVGSVARLRTRFVAEPAASRGGKPPKGPTSMRHNRAESASRTQKSRAGRGSGESTEDTSGGVGYMNTRYGGRRSQSASGRILAHQSTHCIPPGTVMRAKIPKGAKTTTKPEASDLNKSRDYLLTHQEVDRNGVLTTKIVKGECIPTAGGGTAVLFNDVEKHTQGTPYRAYN
ncbi:hypothetical protein QR680_013673 [Steinernema hermaphroditum]|uniref:Kinesin-like protein n=1 Tax=Steinernema hermaphroditum TaxID=289476 RepID=A0AA39I8K6_9BILA|nr:hypothetical protein QR680_013673 [Steinernema hermaphroditum]